MVKAGRIGLMVCLACVATMARGAVRNSFMLNEANAVSGDGYLEQNRSDTTLGRLQGNGQNWIEFITVQGDALPGGGFANTLDLRGWTIDWKYDKNDPTDPDQRGMGRIKFTNDPLWAAFPVGTLLTVTEWKEAWYTTGGPGGGLIRRGGVDGWGQDKGDPQGGSDTYVSYQTDTRWNPYANGGGASGDWRMNVWAGERNPDTSFKYFEFTGEIIDGDPGDPIGVGTAEGGLFVVNNDGWQWTMKDAEGNVIQGPYGEDASGVTAISPITQLETMPNWGVNPGEIFRLEAFAANTNPTRQSYLNAWLNDYQDGSSSSFGQQNIWSGGSGVQSLSPMRQWLVTGDADLNGVVNGNDFLLWQRNVGATNASLTQGDFNGDGAVNGADLTIWKAALPASVGSVAAIPEPCGAALLAAAYVALSSRRCRGTKGGVR